MRLTILDYGAGNIHSLAKAAAVRGAEVRVCDDPLDALETDVLLLPGVGGFDQAARRLAPAREQVRDAIAAGLPCVGICLGLQLLFEGSDEGGGAGRGLGIFPGRVRRLRARRVPHMGWNGGVYFAHSYVCAPEDDGIVTEWATHENDRFPSVVRRNAIAGVQFHPEKSGAAGVCYLRELITACAAAAGGAAR